MNIKVNYFFLRLPIAISLFGHGIARLPKLVVFQRWMTDFMAESFLPHFVVSTWAYLLPFIETILGIVLLIGYRSKLAIYGGLTLMSILIFGSSTIENWGAIEAQLIHATYLFFLLWYYERFKGREKEKTKAANKIYTL